MSCYLCCQIPPTMKSLKVLALWSASWRWSLLSCKPVSTGEARKESFEARGLFHKPNWIKMLHFSPVEPAGLVNALGLQLQEPQVSQALNDTILLICTRWNQPCFPVRRMPPNSTVSLWPFWSGTWVHPRRPPSSGPSWRAESRTPIVASPAAILPVRAPRSWSLRLNCQRCANSPKASPNLFR